MRILVIGYRFDYHALEETMNVNIPQTDLQLQRLILSRLPKAMSVTSYNWLVMWLHGIGLHHIGPDWIDKLHNFFYFFIFGKKLHNFKSTQRQIHVKEVRWMQKKKELRRRQQCEEDVDSGHVLFKWGNLI